MKLSEYLENRTKSMDTNFRAGLIPYCKKNNGYYVCVMKPSDPKYGGSDWQFSKGHIQEQETPQEAAIKEAQEELGYIHKDNYKLNLLWDNKKNRITWYFVETDDMDLDQFGYESSDVKWFEIIELRNIIRDWQVPILNMLKRRLGIKD